MSPDSLLAKVVYFATIDGVASFPEVISVIRAALSEKTATSPSVARAVERDVAFSSRLLRMVNAPEIGLIRPCVSVAHAVSLVGMSRIGMLAEATASRAAIEQCASVAPEIAMRAATNAAIARVLAPLVGAPAEQAFTSALLCDVGAVAIVATQPNRAVTTGLGEAQAKEQITAERAAFGFDHAELGGDILQRWHLPAPIPDVVALHHDLEAARERGPDVARLVALVQVAEALAPLVTEHETMTIEQLVDFAQHPALAFLNVDAAKIASAWTAMRSALIASATASEPVVAASASPATTSRKQPSSPYRAVWIVAAVLVPTAALIAFFH